MIIVAKKPIGRALHEDQVVHFGTDAAKDAKDELDEDRRLEQADVHAETQIIEMADVVAFMFELDVVWRELLRGVFDVGEGVSENIAVGIGDVAPLPVELPRVVTLR